MQSKNTIAIVHMMAGRCGMYKLYMCYLEHRDVGRMMRYRISSKNSASLIFRHPFAQMG